MSTYRESLTLECCKALAARHDNHGDWPYGLPPCFAHYRDLYLPGLGANDHWFSVVEQAIRTAAVLMVAENFRRA